MRVWRVTFHWLGKERDSIDVIAEDVNIANALALQIENKSGSNYRLTNIIRTEQISVTKELEKN